MRLPCSLKAKTAKDLRSPFFFVTFAGCMKNHFFFLTALLLCVISTQAEVLTLRTGTQVQGTIIFQNEEVIVFKDASGARFQYPRADVLSISDEVSVFNQPQADTVSSVTSSKKVSVLLELAGGATFIPADTVGGHFGANLLVGSHDMLGKRIFLGGGIGYIGEFMGRQRYAFLPVQLAVRIPFLQQKNSPIAGIALGYGVALGKEYLGGLYAGVDLGYCYRISTKSALYIAADVQFQQAKIEVQETIEDTSFTNHTGRGFVHTGIRLGFFF